MALEPCEYFALGFAGGNVRNRLEDMGWRDKDYKEIHIILLRDFLISASQGQGYDKSDREICCFDHNPKEDFEHYGLLIGLLPELRTADALVLSRTVSSNVMALEKLRKEAPLEPYERESLLKLCESLVSLSTLPAERTRAA